MNDLYDVNPDELLHYGRKGMKWGQHIFGKIKTAASNARARRKVNQETRKQEKAADALRKKPLSKLTDAELKARIDRLTKEKQAFDLQQQLSKVDQKKVSLGKTFMQKAIDDVAVPAAINAGKEVLERWLKKKGYNIAGLKDNQYAKDIKDELQEAANIAKNKYDKLNYERKLKETEDWFKKRTEDEVEKKIDEHIEKIDERNRAAARERAEQEEREANKVRTGTVSGEGTSRATFDRQQRRQNTRKYRKHSRAYDPPIYSNFADGDTPVSNVRNTSSYAIGLDYMQRLLLE